MRLATILEAGNWSVAVVRDERVLPLAVPGDGLGSVRATAAAGPDGLGRIREWVGRQSEAAWRPLASVELGPAVPDPGAIYTVGLNYRPAGTTADDDPGAPVRPLIYGKGASSVAADGAVLTWDRALTRNVDAECELGVVIGATATAVEAADAMDHVFGFTIINDISSRDPWLDGDQWLIGKSMPGFCPVGPWVETADELDPADRRLGCTIDGVAIQDGRTSQIRTPIAELIAFISRHVELRPGDLIATGTPARLDGPLGPDRHLEIGDVVSVWIEGIGTLTTTVA